MNALIVNGKYFVAPPKTDDDFKIIFQRLAALGAGMPVDGEGFPQKAWTPELLTTEISYLAGDNDGIELRTAQNWFQLNNKGISTKNIYLLARVFGCDDPAKTSEWRAYLSAAQSRLKGNRRAYQNRDNPVDQHATAKNKRFRLALALEALFTSGNSLNLPVLVWSGCTGLGFLSYVFGVHDISYELSSGVSKQVGFLWATSWTILELIFLPAFLVAASNLLNFWKDKRRALLISHGEEKYGESWSRKVQSFSISHWVVLFICFTFVFALQFAGTYMHPIITGDPGTLVIDWSTITTVIPDIMPVYAAIILAFFAVSYAAFICFLFLIGLVLLYTVSHEFYEISCNADTENTKDHHIIGSQIMLGVFHCAVLGILVSSCIKVYVSYLNTSAPNIVSWLFNDLISALRVEVAAPQAPILLSQHAVGNFSSVLLVLVTCYVFFYTVIHVYRVVSNTPRDTALTLTESWRHIELAPDVFTGWVKLVAVFALLVINYFAIGIIPGFSILLIISLVTAFASLFFRSGVN